MEEDELELLTSELLEKRHLEIFKNSSLNAEIKS